MIRPVIARRSLMSGARPEPLMRLLLLCLLTVLGTLPAATARAQSPAVAARPRACGPPPTLAVSAGFEDPRRIFSPRGRSFRTLETRFASAYRLACRSGVTSAPLPSGRLFLKNAPDANTTSIYRDGGEGAASRPMVMEHPFIGHGGRIDIPSVEELRSAIMCSVYNPAPPSGPAEDIVECLVD